MTAKELQKALTELNELKSKLEAVEKETDKLKKSVATSGYSINKHRKAIEAEEVCISICNQRIAANQKKYQDIYNLIKGMQK